MPILQGRKINLRKRNKNYRAVFVSDQAAKINPIATAITVLLNNSSLVNNSEMEVFLIKHKIATLL